MGGIHSAYGQGLSGASWRRGMKKHGKPERRMRVFQIGEFYPPHPGGMETHLEQLSTSLKPFANVRELVSATGSRSITERKSGILIHRAGTVARFANTSISPGLVAAIRHSPAEIVHIHWPNPAAVLAYLASGHNGRLVITYHSDIVRQRVGASLFRPILNRVLARSAAVVCTSPNYAESSPVLRQFRERCHIIPYGIATEKLAA